MIFLPKSYTPRSIVCNKLNNGIMRFYPPQSDEIRDFGSYMLIEPFPCAYV